MKKLNVYIVADAYYPSIGGMQQVVNNFAVAMSKIANVVLFAPKSKNYKDDNGINVFRVKSICLSYPNYYVALPWADKKLKKFLKENPPDIINVHNLAELSYWFAKYGRENNIPVISTMHGFIENDLKIATDNKLIQKVGFKYLSRPLKYFDYIWAVSNKCANYYRNLGCKNVSVVTNAVDELKSSLKIDEITKTKYGIKSNDEVLCYVNKLSLAKNVELMLKAINIVIKQKPNLQVIIAGAGPDEEKIKRIAKSLNLTKNVQFAGLIKNRQEIASLFKISKVNLFPSVVDTSGLTILESASQNTPTIAMKESASKECITDEISGYLSENTPEDYANTILKALNDKNLYNSIKKNVKDMLYFNWNDYSKNALEKFEKLLKLKKI